MVVALGPPLRQAARIYLSPTNPFFRQCKNFTPLLPCQAFPSRGVCSAKKKGTRSEHRRSRPHSVARRDVPSQTRSRKQFWKGAMEERTKATSNGHLRRSSSRISWPSHNGCGQGDWQISSFSGTSNAIPPFSLHLRILLCNCWAKIKSRKLGCRRYKASGEKIREPPEQRIRTRGMIEARKKGNQAPLQRLLPIWLWSRT